MIAELKPHGPIPQLCRGWKSFANLVSHAWEDVVMYMTLKWTLSSLLQPSLGPPGKGQTASDPIIVVGLEDL